MTLSEFQKPTRSLVALTAYSYPFARLLDEAGVDLILVGDSLGMVEHGREDTTTVTLEEMAHHTRSVRRGVHQALLVTDLPAGTYTDPEQALQNARVLIEAGAEAVKLEGGIEVAAIVSHLVSEGIPVMGHIGMLPQRIREEGKYRIKGKTPEGRKNLLRDAKALEEAGAFSLVLELVTPTVSAEITNLCSIPTIGIGSGDSCKGQILVTYDLVGLSPWFKPGFVKPKAEIGETIRRVVREFAEEIRRK